LFHGGFKTGCLEDIVREIRSDTRVVPRLKGMFHVLKTRGNEYIVGWFLIGCSGEILGENFLGLWFPRADDLWKSS